MKRDDDEEINLHIINHGKEHPGFEENDCMTCYVIRESQERWKREGRP